MCLISFQDNKLIGKFLFVLFTIFSFILPLRVQSQMANRTITITDTVHVSISNISISNEFSVRGLNANFPYPVISTISLVDSQGNTIPGLADTLHWLTADNIAQNGMRISEIWSNLLEYHLENPSIPVDPNLYNQIPSPLITEVRETMQLPTSTMLVMDASSSMLEEIEDAKAGARLFVNLMRSVDQAGIVQFAEKVDVIQPLTNDKNLLTAIINRAELTKGTALYDGIMAAIQEIKRTAGRRGIIVYTDGKDNSSKFNSNAVIDSARVYHLPVFTIALGLQTSEQELQRIAAQTGGLFFKAATAQEMKLIYARLSELIQNYYLMAHTSPDPNFNDSWRVVDVTINTPQFYGRGTGHYYVPGLPMPTLADLSIALDSKTDSTMLIGGNTVNFVHPGDSYQYNIKLQNLGPGAADSIKIYHFLPRFVSFVSASEPPLFVDNDLVFWQFNDFQLQSEKSISVDVLLEPGVPTEMNKLPSFVHVTSINDTILNNNFDPDTVWVKFPEIPPTPVYDLALSQQAITDTFIVIGQDTVQAVVTGRNFSYSFTIENKGPDIAKNFTLWNLPPDSVTAFDFNISPSSQSNDTLFWQFDSLNHGETLSLSYKAQVKEILPLIPFPLVNVSQVVAEFDTLQENNFSSTTVYAIKPIIEIPGATDLAIAINSVTDTTIIIDGDTISAVQPGDDYSYRLKICNLGKNRAMNVQVLQILPDSVNFIEANIPPFHQNDDSLVWHFDHFELECGYKLLVHVRAKPELSENLIELISTVTITADNDTLASNNSDADTVRVLFPPPVPVIDYDLALYLQAITDTSIILHGDTVKAAIRGSQYQYKLKIENSGPAVAYNFTLWNAIPESVTVSDFTIQPDNRILNTYFWRFDSLSPDQNITIDFNANVANSFETLPFKLSNSSEVISENDINDENNFAQVIVYAIARPGDNAPMNSDVSVQQIATTDSFSVVQKDTIDFARASETYRYSIIVKNESLIPALNATVINYLPDSVTAINFAPDPYLYSKDSLVWHLGYV